MEKDGESVPLFLLMQLLIFSNIIDVANWLIIHFSLKISALLDFHLEAKISDNFLIWILTIISFPLIIY